MRSGSYSLMILFAVAVFTLSNQTCEAQHHRRGPISEIIQVKRDYVTDKPFQYQPSDPWNRSHVFQLQTGHWGKFNDCDDEEQKRCSPYICWKVHFERDIPVHTTCVKRFHDTIDTVRQRINDGAGACCKNGCESCTQSAGRDGGLRIARQRPVRSAARKSACGNANCSGSCGNTSCRQKAELARRLAAATRNVGGQVVATGKSVASRTVNGRLLGSLKANGCANGDCAPVPKVRSGCRANCGCADCSLTTESSSGLISNPAAAHHLSSQRSSTSMAFVKQTSPSQTINVSRNQSTQIEPIRRVQAAKATVNPNSKDQIFSKAPCNCIKCQLEQKSGGTKLINQQALGSKDAPERTAKEVLINRIRGLTDR